MRIAQSGRSHTSTPWHGCAHAVMSCTASTRTYLRGSSCSAVRRKASRRRSGSGSATGTAYEGRRRSSRVRSPAMVNRRLQLSERSVAHRRQTVSAGSSPGNAADTCAPAGSAGSRRNLPWKCRSSLRPDLSELEASQTC